MILHKLRWFLIIASLFTLVLTLFTFKNSVPSAKTDASAIPLRSNPSGVAIDPVTDVAVVTNQKSDSVSIIDLNTLAVLSSIPVGKKPKGIAIDKGMNIAVIGNSHDNTISMIDLNTYQLIKTIPVGKKPSEIAIDDLTHRAFVVNHEDSSVSVIDLTSLSVIETVIVGRKPEDIAVDPGLHIGLVVNDKDHTISVLDLDTYQVIGNIPSRKKPQAIDINPETHIAVVSNEKDNSITVIDLQTLQIIHILIKKHPVNVAINQLNNRALVFCDKERSLLLIDLNTYMIIKTFALKKFPKGIAVNNFTNVAAVVDYKTDSLSLIQLPNPVPEIMSITPDNAPRGSDGVIITLEGNKFIKTSTPSIKLPSGVRGLTGFFTDNHLIQATIPEEILSKAGVFPVTVTNPQPEGGTSNTMSFTVYNPIPSINVLEPAEAIAGMPELTLNMYGTGFFDDTEIYFNGIKKLPTYVNNNKLQVKLKSEDLKTPGQYEIMAYNLPPGGGNSNKVTFTIRNPLEIKITSPTDGETFNKTKVIVKGTIRSDTRDVGITVNGIIAEIYGNEWIANDVPLAIGSNTIEAIATDSYGNTDKKTIIVYTNDTVEPLELRANITSGIPPFQVDFSVSTYLHSPISIYKFDYEGDGVIDYTGETIEELSYTYTTEGIFYPTITVIDNQGNAYSDTIAVTVMNKTEIDTLLKAKWEGMKSYIAKQDIENALDYYSEESKELYNDIYTAFYDQLPQVAQEIQDIQLIYVQSNTAKYRLRKNEVYGSTMETITYYIYFILDRDGIWKIYRY